MIQAIALSMLSISIICSIYFFLELRKEREKVQWFENWGKEYLEKHRDKAREDGLSE